MSNRRYTTQDSINQIFYKMPKVLFINSIYKKLSSNAKIMYMLMNDRLQLSIMNNWVNDKNEVYFVYPVEKLMALTCLSKPTVIKSKKELIDVSLLEEERTGRANKMYLLQPISDESDLYEIRKQDLDLDENADKIERNEIGQIARSKDIELQADEVNETRSQNIELQVETLRNQDLSENDQKSNILTSEVNNIDSNKNNINKIDEEEEYHINNPIFLQLKNSKLFTKQEIEQIMIQLDECVNEEMVKEQLDVMAMQPRLLSPMKYFLNGINKTIRLYEFKAEMMLNKKAN